MINALLPIFLRLAAPVDSRHQVATRPGRPNLPVICLATRLLPWRGTSEETKRIGTEPVPGSYRREYNSGACEHLEKESLIAWHLEVGTEASTKQALEFLATTALKGMPSGAALNGSLHEAWVGARDDVERIHRTSRAPTATPDWLAFEQLKSLKRVRALVTAYERYRFVSDVYLRGAEFFRSGELLAIGLSYFTVTLRASEVIFAGKPIIPAVPRPELDDLAGLRPYDIRAIRDLEMRYAVARAQISRSPADIEAASEVVRANNDVVTRDSARALLDQEDRFCESKAASEALRVACKHEANLARRLQSFWRNAAQVQLLAGKETLPTPETESNTVAIALHAIRAARARYGVKDALYDAFVDDLVALLLLRVENNVDRFIRSQDDEEARLSQYALTHDLLIAERLTPAALSPNRFRQIADLYLRFIDSARSKHILLSPDQVRQAAYLRIVRDQLDQISVGATPSAATN